MSRILLLALLLALALVPACASADEEDEPARRVRAPVPAPERAPNTLTEEERAAGWRLLFDGATTAGWRGYRQESMPEGWQVVDGALARVAPAGDIVTVEQFGDFVLELEWKIEPGGNSGVFFRVSEDRPAVYETGPELQVLDDRAHGDGLDPRTSAGSNYALHAPRVDATRPAGEWNQVRIEVRGEEVTHRMNGREIVSYRLWNPEWEALVEASKFAAMPGYGRNRRGHIALQDHGDPVRFRSIRILPLDRP